MPDAGIEREIKRLRTKIVRFEEGCDNAGLSLRMVYAAVKKWSAILNFYAPSKPPHQRTNGRQTDHCTNDVKYSLNHSCLNSSE